MLCCSTSSFRTVTASRSPGRSGRGGPIVVLISSREEEDYGQRVADCGARGFIPKSKLSPAAFAALVG